jgi:para-aminobenzoate synthetase component 1
MTAGPLVEELSPAPEIMVALRALADQPGVLLLESARPDERLGRYSFLTADPFDWIEIADVEFGVDPFAALRSRMSRFATDSLPDLPPFQGGAAGLMGYELGHAFERIPQPAGDEFAFPDLAVGLYDWVIAWDRAENRAWIISQGFPETDQPQREQRAQQRLTAVKARLAGTALDSRPRDSVHRHPLDKLSTPTFPAPGLDGLLSDFSHDGYLLAAARVIEYIYAGDIFQANLSQRLMYRSDVESIDLYERLRQCNPAPFAGYFAHDDWAVVSASPERFVYVQDGDVETRPIKGTRRRKTGPEADLFTRDELRESDKDTAENVMIVDLLRNDLSRVCEPGSIRVPSLCDVESYETVQHLVSEIRGRLASGRDAWDLFSAVVPGGSITGAPKVRAMEIIAELEPTARGPYCGNLFYAGFDGAVDSSILIRTFIHRHGWIQCPVGGGIVAQSDPLAEYEETLAKATGMLAALTANH